jgi:N-acetylneuraminate synthase
MSVLIIAEVGSVHDGSFGNALRLIDTAAECGADIVKFQTHIADAESIPSAPSPSYFKGEPRFQYFKRTSFNLDQWSKISRHCESAGIQFLSSPFSVEAVNLLESAAITMYKVASGEVTNLPLLKAIGATKKPVLLSSGMSSWSELDQAVNTIRSYHNKLTIFQCRSEYPCSLEHVGLNILDELKTRYKVSVGYSDHTTGPYAALAAVALGATVIEKHLTFSRKMYGSDAPYATEPAEFAELVRGIRTIDVILANPIDKDDLGTLKDMKQVFEKSLVPIRDLAAGTVISEELLTCKKPGSGIPPSEIPSLLGRRLKYPVSADVLLTFDDLEEK